MCVGIRALLNRAMGIYVDLDDEVDPLAGEIDPAPPPPPPPTPPAPPKGSAKVPDGRKWVPLRLGKFVDNIGRAFSAGKADPLAEIHALSIRILIGAILKEALPADTEAPDRIGLAPDTQDGWVRLLGRLLIPVPRALRTAAGARNGPLVDEQVELLAVLRWSAFLCLDAAQAHRMKDEVVRQLVRIVRDLETSALLPGDTGERLLERCNRALEEKYGRLRPAARGERDARRRGAVS
jgi:hypothetical protein